MLGALNSVGPWVWAAFGKHPVASDYLSIGSDAPIFSAFSNWLSSGHRALAPKQDKCPRPYSWRFWAKGVRKNHVLCGLFKASSDRIGRCYPLMILGTGEVRAWEKGWDLLPLLFENLWRRMESISSRSYPAFDAFREELSHLGKPPAGRQEIQQRQEQLRRHERWEEAARAMERRADDVMRAPQSIFRMEDGYFDDPLVRIGFWHYMLCRRTRRPPNAVFIGGVTERLYLAVLNRPIAYEDYVRLCTVEDT
jgi:type VI secretion system protein VasJ